MPAIAIKATHINNLTDARYFAVFAEWIGFKLANDDPQALSLDQCCELMGWVSGVLSGRVRTFAHCIYQRLSRSTTIKTPLK